MYCRGLAIHTFNFAALKWHVIAEVNTDDLYTKRVVQSKEGAACAGKAMVA